MLSRKFFKIVLIALIVCFCFNLVLAAAPTNTIKEIPFSNKFPNINLKSAGINYSQFDGMRVKTPNDPKIYLVDQGKRRWIPNPPTFNNLFRNWDVYVGIDIMSIPEGKQITDGAFLSKGSGPEVYLIDNGVKRWIISPAVMDKYNFDWNKIVVIPQLAINYIPTGPNIN